MPMERSYAAKDRAIRSLIYFFLFVTAFSMLIPFAWMLSASLKLNKDVFTFPIEWIPKEPRWANYSVIWTRIPLMRFIYNTFKLAIIITTLQLLSSSFAAYAFAKLRFPFPGIRLRQRHRHGTLRTCRGYHPSSVPF